MTTTRLHLSTSLLLSCLFLSVACGKSPSKSSFSLDTPNVSASNRPTTTQPRIINGSEIGRNETPQIVKIVIRYQNGSEGLCSGTVIGDNDILTAGHCFSNSGFSSPASAAAVERPDSSQMSISAIYTHPAYREEPTLSAIFNDVAIVKTRDPLNLPTLPILASPTIEPGSTINLYGFGLDENGNLGSLRSGSMLVANTTPNHIFAYFDGLSNSCNGDSGGPATYTEVEEGGNILFVGIVGIISTGNSQNCSPGELSLFTNVQSTEILNFIAQIVPEAIFL